MSAPTKHNPTSTFSDLIPYLGLNISGDLDGMTIYTTRKGKIVWYPESPADKPPSPLQTKQRLRFRIAQRNYMLLPRATKALWEHLTKTLAIPVTGQNAFISYSFSQNSHELAVACAKVGITLTLPPAVPN